MAALELVWNLIARDGASPAFARAGASAEGAALSVGKLTKALGVVGLGAAVVEAVKSASDFNAKMALVQTQAGASAAEVAKMSPAILSLSGQVAEAPEALATSLYHVESTGLRGAQALEAVKIAAEGARVGHADLEQTTNALTATIASGMLPATETYAQAMGQLNTIVGSGDMKMSDLNEALASGLLVTTKQYGVTITDVGAALADFGDNNIRGADAATKLRMAVQAIAKPGVDAGAALGEIGLTVQQIQDDLSHGGLNKALTDLHTHLVNSGIDASQWGQIMTDAFTKKAGAGIITLIGTFDRFEQKYKEVDEGAAGFGKAWQATTKTAAFQFAQLGDAAKALGINVGNALLPPFSDLAHVLTVVVNPLAKTVGLFGQLPEPVKDAALAIGGLALATKVGVFTALSSGVTGLRGAFSRLGETMAVQQAPAVAGAQARMASATSELAAAEGRLSDLEARRTATTSELATVTQRQALIDANRARLDAEAAVSSAGRLAAIAALTANATAETGALTAAQAAMRGYDAMLATTAVEEDAVAVSSGRLSIALGTVATRAGVGIGKLTAFLGGGWGIGAIAAIAGLTEGIPALVHWLGETNNVVPKVTVNMQGLTAALQQSNGAIDDAVVKAAALTVQQAGLFKAAQQWHVSTSLLVEAATGNKTAMDQVSAAAGKYKDAMLATASSQAAEADQTGITTDAYKRAAIQSDEWLAAVKRLASGTDSGAQKSKDLQTAIDGATAAGKDAAPTLEQVGNAAGMSADQITAANKAWEDWIKSLTGDIQQFFTPLQTYQTDVQNMAQATADATKSSKDSWQDYVDSVKVNLDDYAKQLEGQIKNEQDWQANLVKIAQRGGEQLAQQFAAMGPQAAGLVAQMADATGAQFQRMATDMGQQAQLGGATAVKNLDDAMRVMAQVAKDGAGATAAGISTELGLGADQVYDIAQRYGVNLATGLNPVLAQLDKHPIIINTLLSHPMWSGGYAGDGGKYTPMGIVHGGEFVFTKEQTAKAGVPTLEAMARVLSGYSGGGFVTPADVPRPFSTAPFSGVVAAAGDGTMNTGYNAAVNFLSGVGFGASAPGAPANVSGNVALGQLMAARYGWGSGAEWNSLYALWQRESGWNNNAQNPTSTAYGIPQFLNSTWAGVGYPKSSDPAVQIAAGLKYIAGRYGDPVRAWGHEVSAGWYDSGGWLQPGDVGANGLSQPEAVLTPAESGAYKQMAAAFASGGLSITGRLEIGGDGLARIIDGRLNARDAVLARNGRSA